MNYLNKGGIRKMTTLYKLNENYEQTLNKILFNDLENEDDLIEELAKLEIVIEEKAENTAIVLKELEAQINKFKEEETRLSKRRKTLENNVKFLKSNLEDTMILQDKKKFKTEHFSFNLQKNAPSVKILDEEKALNNYKKIKEEIDKQKLKEDLKNGLELDYAVLEQSESLRIR